MKRANESGIVAQDTLRYAFGPSVLLALSLAMVLGWNVFQAWRQQQVIKRMLAQNVVVLQQAAATELRLQALLMELVTLAQTDPQAKSIVEKYQIRYNQPGTAPVSR